ncbi:MAG TPA: flagellar basal body-associated FliL family protein [Stellaceae bacterium]|nr:flagellar basal body-associated FliL family protein [Stellaceae bacterium]
MSETRSAAQTPAPPRGGRSLRLIMLAFVLVLVVAAGGAGYMFLWHPRGDAARPAAAPAAALPFYLEIKPFVVSMEGEGDSAHFVQLGVNLTLSGPALGQLVSAVLPEVQDAMRQAVLGFKVADITTPAGVDKLRRAMTERVNHVLLQRLGAQRIAAVNGGETKAVRNIYFSTLVIE